MQNPSTACGEVEISERDIEKPDKPQPSVQKKDTYRVSVKMCVCMSFSETTLFHSPAE